MGRIVRYFSDLMGLFWDKLNVGMQAKLIILFLLVKVIPLILLTVIAWHQINTLGVLLKEIAVEDASSALNDSAVENIERMTTDTAGKVAEFLYARDDDIRYVAGLNPSDETYRSFIDTIKGRVVKPGTWELDTKKNEWVLADAKEVPTKGGVSTNKENNDMDGFNYRNPETYEYENIPLYDEITFIDTNGNEVVKIVSEDSTKVNYPLNAEKRNVAQRENTYVKAETYFEELKNLKAGEIYVSDVIGAYTKSNFIGMYTPENVKNASKDRGYDINYNPEEQAYAGMENPKGQRFEGIVRWATPVTDNGGAVIGYVTLALNHDHLMELVDHLTPMNERYTQLPNADGGNYAFIWDYQCRSICHPRHHSIVGYNPETGDPEIPWLETSIYDAWQQSGEKKWNSFITGWPTFDNQSREKKPAAELTKQGLVGLDGRYLNNAPQCTGWMDLTKEGGSGSFYILWSGVYKLTTAASIPYYTGQYAPSEENDYSKRGFGFVAIGAGLEDFTRPAQVMEKELSAAVEDNLSDTFVKLIVTTAILIGLVVLIAIWMASFLTGNITKLIKGISRFRAGERQFRFNAPVKDEFGTLADSFDDMADSIVDSVKNPLCITDMRRTVIYMNEPGLTLRKMKLEEIVGTPYGDNSIYPEGSKYCPITALEEDREADIYYVEDTDRYIKGSASYFLNKDGEKIGYFVITDDVTEMVREQLEIESQRTLLDRIFSASPDLIWYEDAKGVYMTVNPRFASIAGASPDAFVGKTAEEMLQGDIARAFIEYDQEAIVSAKPLYTEEHILFADGHEETLESVRTPIFDGNEKLIGLLGFARNVTIRVRIENELRNTQFELKQAVNDANRANEHKGEFLARMSHEIRTPMNAIIGLTNIVQKRIEAESEKPLEAKDIKENLDQIETSSQHLLGLLNDILDISKIEAGKIELSNEITDLQKLANTVMSIIRPRCEEKNIDFKMFFEQFTPTSFECDSLRLRQVLINLLGNAVKFTPELGSIELRIERKDREEGRALIEFVVRDNGIGISDEKRAVIFQPFEQGGAGIARNYGGTGLGLAISCSIVNLFGGEIQLESAEGEGSEFSFQIWLKEVAPIQAMETEFETTEDKFKGKRVLLVDDVEINRMIVISLLEDTGIIIDEADDGFAALDQFERSEVGEYDIIFMDIQMPNMDGYESSLAIRGLDRPDAKTVPIIALTANAFKEDIDKALNHGMNAHITKPIEIEKLLEVLARYVK